MKQSSGSTASWKPRLLNEKSHVKKKIIACRITRHFIESCNDNGSNDFRHTLVDYLINIDGLTVDKIADLLLKKENFWVETLVRLHQKIVSMTWIEKKRCESEKLNN